MKNREVGLWDLPDDKVYLKIKSPFREDFFNYAIKISGSMVKLTKLLNFKSHDSIRGYKYGYYFIPLRVVKEILLMFPKIERINIKKQREKNIEKLKTMRGKSIKNTLPIRFSSTLAKIAGHLVGDGGIRIRNGAYTVRYANNSIILIEQFEKDMLKVFLGVNSNKYFQKENRKDQTYHISFPAITGVILTTLFGPLEGDMKHIPEVILKSSKKSKSLFLRALFDDEGSTPSSNCIRLEMANKGIIEAMEKMIRKFGIKPGEIREIDDPNSKKIKYNFHISGFYDLRTFSKKIDFDHLEKKEKLNFLLKKYRHIQYKHRETKDLIIHKLKDKKMSLYELAQNLERKPTAKFRKGVLDLEKNGIIKSNMLKNRLKIYSIKNINN